jgi:hypothetical protein
LPSLARLLRNAGHDVQIPADANISGEDDAVHFTHAIRERRVLLSGNHDDFEQLHYLVIQSGGHHPGILIVRPTTNGQDRQLTSVRQRLGQLRTRTINQIRHLLRRNNREWERPRPFKPSASNNGCGRCPWTLRTAWRWISSWSNAGRSLGKSRRKFIGI